MTLFLEICKADGDAEEKSAKTFPDKLNMDKTVGVKSSRASVSSNTTSNVKYISFEKQSKIAGIAYRKYLHGCFLKTLLFSNIMRQFSCFLGVNINTRMWLLYNDNNNNKRKRQTLWIKTIVQIISFGKHVHVQKCGFPRDGKYTQLMFCYT